MPSRLDSRSVFGAISLAVGLVLLAIFGQQYDLSCTRTEPSQPDGRTNGAGLA
jgi:hypothetical protein